MQASQFQGTCAGYPGLGFGFGGATVQFGENSDSYVDWRFRIGFDLTDDNLLYLLVATGNKAPSFNDTIDLDTGPGGGSCSRRRSARKRTPCSRSARRTRSTSPAIR